VSAAQKAPESSRELSCYSAFGKKIVPHRKLTAVKGLCSCSASQTARWHCLLVRKRICADMMLPFKAKWPEMGHLGLISRR
jgi:hypothetical protein